jgi:predicted transcriptional regulator
MTDKRQKLLEKVSALPEELLDEVGQSVEEVMEWHKGGIYHLNDEERASVRRGMEAARRGEFATQEQVDAVINRSRGK